MSLTELGDRLQSALGDAYRIERELGGGGMSRVFLAEEVRLGRRVVVKVLPPEMAAGVNAERFEREIQLAARLQHPHVVPVLTAGAKGDLLYYIMPFIEGESLRAKLAREGELPVVDVLRILKEVLDALAYAHRQGLVHRDIKPDNILLSQGHAVVTDFGVAKAVSESAGSSSLTSLGVALGTPAYMSPEQAAANPQIDHRADIYAVGAMAYEMLSGRPPFVAANAQAMLAAHVTQRPDPVSAHRPAVSEGLSAVIQRCLEKLPADRWQRAEELIPHVDAMLTPTGTQPVRVDYEQRARQAHPVRVAALFGVAAAVVLAAVYGLMQVIGLPDWVFLGAVGLLAVGLPIMLLTGYHERQRAIAKTTGMSQATPTGVKRYFTWRKSLLGGGLAFASLGVLTVAFMLMRALGIGPIGTLVASGALGRQERLLLADFENATNDSTMGESVTELLRIDLGQSRVLTLLEPAQVAEILERMRINPTTPLTPQLAQEVAAREGIKAYVTGDVRSIGTGFVITARLVAAGTGDAMVTGRETAADASQLIPAVDRLSRHLRERVGESLKALRADPPLERLTTSSLEALRLYAQAATVADQGDYRRAIGLLEEAVQRDTTFAMAYRRLGMYKTNPQFRVQMGQSGDSALRRAYALRDRVAERERYHIEAAYWSRAENDVERAVTAYLAVLEKYPNDATALNNLAVQYGLLGRYAERDAKYREAIDRGVAPAITYTNLLGSLRERGDLAQADTIIERFAAQHNSPQVLQQRASQAGARQDWPEVVRLAEEARVGHPTLDVWALNQLAQVAELEGRLREANQLHAEAIRRDAQRQSLSSAERDYLIELGELERRIRFADDRAAFAPQVEQMWRRNREFVRGRRIFDQRHPRFIGAFFDVGRADRVEQIGAEFFSGIEESFRGLSIVRDGERMTAAAVATLRERFDEAVTLVQAVRRDSPQCALCNLVVLAELYDRAGNADSALAYYERYQETPGARLGMDAQWMARSLKRMGELYETAGRPADAIEAYTRFTELWANADRELQPVVADVRARIARLTRERR